MTFSRSQTLRRIALLCSTAAVAAVVSLASTLPGPAGDKGNESTIDTAPASLLPGIGDASTSYTDTANASPAATGAGSAGQAIETTAAPSGPLTGRVASGELVATVSDTAIPDHNGCMPEPVSVILMTSGLAGLLLARRLRK